MKLIYFHGFASSGASGTVQLLRLLLPDDDIIAPDIPVDPIEALPLLRELCAQEQPDIIVGTSMGGMYAQQMFGYRRICVNPAFNMSTMSQGLKTGTHRWLNGRKNHEKEFHISKDIIQHFNQMERQQFKGITAADAELCYGLFGTADTVVKNGYQTFTKHYPTAHALRFEGDHQLNEKALRKAVLPLISQLLNPS